MLKTYFFTKRQRFYLAILGQLHPVIDEDNCMKLLMVNSVYFVKSTLLTPFMGSSQNSEDMLQAYKRSACASLMLIFFDRMAGFLTERFYYNCT